MARVGKNLLESVTRSMYKDSKCVYREYIQNAADQIDTARKLRPDLDYNVYVTIEQQLKRITIEDNATGVRADSVRALLIDVACSEKVRGVNKGFRGIGRLGGLAYCKTLKFETSYFDEDIVSIVTWDAVRLTQILDDNNDDSEVGEVIDSITQITVKKDDSYKEKHYFKVIMEDVTDEKLLVEKDIRDYLSMVSPVDYSNHFVFRRKIYDFMKEHNLHLDCYNIFVGDTQIFKDYTMSFVAKQMEDDISGVDFFYQTNNLGVPIYWGWYSISHLRGIIKNHNAANIRLRCENIQLGDETTCYKFMTNGDKHRFVRYFFGEINVLPSSKLVPNSDRDYLREDDGLKEFENLVEKDFLKLEKLCYLASGLRTENETIRRKDAEKKSIEEKLSKGVVSEESKEKLQKSWIKLQEDRQKAYAKLAKLQQEMQKSNSPLLMLQPINATPILTSTSKTEQPTNPSYVIASGLRTDNVGYNKFNAREKKLILTIYNVIDQTLNNEKEREALIDKIEKEITK